VSNMNHCRFQNTLTDLKQCNSDFDNMELSDEERDARIKLFKLCKKIAESYDEFIANDEREIKEEGKENV